jgi:hypothetical protein
VSGAESPQLSTTNRLFSAQTLEHPVSESNGKIGNLDRASRYED